jgi:catechol 2,3-dioxygenase-like lactoylglutathione lyase family enzyme
MGGVHRGREGAPAGQGVAIELGPVERHAARGKGTSLYFRDPDGSLLEFISYA